MYQTTLGYTVSEYSDDMIFMLTMYFSVQPRKLPHQPPYMKPWLCDIPIQILLNGNVFNITSYFYVYDSELNETV